MTPKEVIKRTIAFSNPDRLVRHRPNGDTDFSGIGMTPNPDARGGGGQREFIDEWGAVWENIGICKLGEVKEFPLKDWNEFDQLNIPDVKAASRWNHEEMSRVLKENSDKFILCNGISLYERVHFLRGLEETWIDIYENPDKLKHLIGILTRMNLDAIEIYAQYKPDGFMFCDDWGLQNALMVSPDAWREFWKPAYAKIYRAAHDAGMLTFLHSCGHTVEILDDLIDAGLNVIQMDQQENMGLELLGERFGGRLAFWCPVDIQQTMCHGSEDEIRAYCQLMFKHLGSKAGGFIPGWYGDPVGAGHSDEAQQTMFDEFDKMSLEIYGKCD
jgi:uroporphyrinogen decarboxylase